MGDLVRVFERFLGRDLVYILAGAIPLLSLGRFLWAGRYLPELACLDGFARLEQVSWVWIALSVGVAWVVGYALQELFCLVGLSSTAVEGEPGCFVRWLFRRLQKRGWTPRNFNGPDGELDAQMRLEMAAGAVSGAHLERRAHLMQVGTAVGPGFVVGGILLMGSWWQGSGAFDLIIGMVLVVAGLFLLCLGAFKRLQLREYVFKADQMPARQPTGTASTAT